MRYGRFSTSEPGEFELALRPWDLVLDSRGGTDQRFEIEYFNAPGLTVAREHYFCDVRLIGMPPSDQLVLAIPVNCKGETSFHGVRTISGQLYSLNGESLEARYGGPNTILSVQLDLSQEVAPTLAPLVEKLAPSGRTFEVAHSVEDVSQLVRIVNQLFRLQEFYSNGSADRYSARGHELLRPLEEALSRVVFRETQDLVVGSKAAQFAAVSTALEYLRTPGVECASVSELCAKAGVCERMLQRGVRAQFDCTVVQLLRKWRLHAARRRLLVAGPNETTVSHVAITFGFRDFGRFASSYRQLFGEYPSVTLADPSRWIAPCLGLFQ
jgi:AraC-like DNA-binding protein